MTTKTTPTNDQIDTRMKLAIEAYADITRVTAAEAKAHIKNSDDAIEVVKARSLNRAGFSGVKYPRETKELIDRHEYAMSYSQLLRMAKDQTMLLIKLENERDELLKINQNKPKQTKTNHEIH